MVDIPTIEENLHHTIVQGSYRQNRRGTKERGGREGGGGRGKEENDRAEEGEGGRGKQGRKRRRERGGQKTMIGQQNVEDETNSEQRQG